jgi:hypothetical protein
MRYIFENTSEDDRYYSSRKSAFEGLSAFQAGTYTLFPGIENLPGPEAQITTRFNGNRRETVIDLNDSPFGGSFGDMTFGQPTQPAVQMSLFKSLAASPLPILSSVEEQRAVIDNALKHEAKEIENRENEPFLDISDEDKTRLYEQFSDNSRSRAAVNLVREIYGDALGMPLPQAIQKITELVEAGLMDGIGDLYDLFDNVRDELFNRGYAVSGEVIEDGINLFRTQVGHGEFAEIADFIVDEYLS